MPNRITRRSGLMTLAATPLLAGGAAATTETTPAVAENFPAQPLEFVRETVLVAHGNFKRLRELVDAHPSLSKAAYDWGFGDWEDALGAASHVRNREIAEYLIAHGARPTLYSATMFGQLDVVKAFVAAQPGCQRIPGPHGIPLLAHAKDEAVIQYLEGLGDAGAPLPAPITEQQKAALAGTYTFGGGPRDVIEIEVKGNGFLFTRKGAAARGLVHVGNLAFHPAGAEAVRVVFAGNGTETRLTVHDPGPILVAKRNL